MSKYYLCEFGCSVPQGQIKASENVEPFLG